MNEIQLHILLKEK